MKPNTNIHPWTAATAWFKRMMDTKIHENVHKGHWADDDWVTLFGLMLDEVEELKEELDKPEHDAVAIAREAADVANFAMMIADNARHTLKGSK